MSSKGSAPDNTSPAVPKCIATDGSVERVSTLSQHSESSLRALLQAIPDLIWLKNSEGVYLACNHRFQKFFGASENEIVGRTDYDFVSKELADQFRAHDRAAMTKGSPSTNEEWVTFADDGHHELLETTKTPVLDAQGSLIGVLGVGHDITQRKQTEQYEQFRSSTLELLAGDTPLAVILEAIVRGVERLHPDMLCSILLLDEEGRRLRGGIAPSLPSFYNAAIEGVEIGLGVGSCGTAAFTAERVIVDDISTHPYWTGFADLASKAGLGACWSQPILSSSHEVLGTFAIYHHKKHVPSESDIYVIEQSARLASIAIERKHMEEKVRRLAFHDTLTGLPNRLLLNDRVEQAIAASKRNGRYAALLFLDLDNFKPLNDEYGHDAGDLLLKEVAHRLGKCVREVDTIARFGGDEFVVVLSELFADKAESTSQVLAIAEKIRFALALPYVLDIQADGKSKTTVSHHCTASIGAVLFSSLDSSAVDIVKSADLAMYQAKAAGRNRVQLFGA
jgi:diguanylate cyclase (GGDEF)-like protein/PAS domain S-box-containing protein